MKNNQQSGWKRPGMRSGDYGLSEDHNHDHRIYSGVGPKNYHREDGKILEEVCEILYWNPDVDATEVEVSVEKGIVSLNGFVDSRHAKKTAESVIEEVRGLRDVNNRLIIKKDLDMDSDKIITRGDDGLFSQETLQR